MVLALLFVLGIANFAMHKAVLESGHPLLGQVPWFVHLLGGRFGLVVEFGLLFGAMALSVAGSSGATIAYVAYSAFNAFAAWLILTRRI